MALWAAGSLVFLAVFIFFVIRPMALWVIRTPSLTKHVEEKYIFAILVVAVIGFVSEMAGATSFNCALVVGIAILDGRLLGSTLDQKLDCSVTDMLMPLYFVMVGRRMSSPSRT